MTQTPGFQRARDAAQRGQRREQILAAAEECLADTDWPAITMAAIARRSGLGKGTPYRYFATKEELFLELAARQLIEWNAGLEADLARPGASYQDFTTRFVRSLAGRPQLRLLLGLLYGVLLQNVTPEAATSFTYRLMDSMRRLADTLESYDVLPEGRALRFLIQAHALLVGLDQMARTSRAVHSEESEDTEPKGLVVDFQADLRSCLEALIRSL